MFTVTASLSPIVPLVLAFALVASPVAASDDRTQTPTKSTSPASDTTHDKDHPARVRAASPRHAAEKSHEEKVNINSADVKELMSLTGVGRKVAEKIVEYRDTHGSFKKADELRKVDGIGNGLWEKNRDRIVTK